PLPQSARGYGQRLSGGWILHNHCSASRGDTLVIHPQLLDDSPRTVSDHTLRQFAGLCVVILGLLFGLSWYRHSGHPTAAGWISLVLAVCLGIPGLFRPSLVRPIYLGALAATHPIGQAVSLLMLGFVYYGLVTPLAAVFRLTGRDALVRRRPD